jgi:hypothetical protein
MLGNGRHRFEKGKKPALTQWLDHEPVAVAKHGRFIARQFEFHGDADRLVAAVPEQSDASLLGHLVPLRVMPDQHMPATSANKASVTSLLLSPVRPGRGPGMGTLLEGTQSPRLGGVLRGPWRSPSEISSKSFSNVNGVISNDRTARVRLV